MGELLPMGTPGGISWDAASVEAPQLPMLPAGDDAMSATISAVLPTLGAPLTASVAALSAKENQFSSKVGAAESAYQNADSSGGQSVGQLSSMLGQVGQMAQQAGGSGGGGGFASLMQQAMQAFQSGGSGSGSTGGSPSGGSQSGATGPGAQGVGAAPQQSKDDAAHGEHQKPDADEKDRETPRDQAHPPLDAAGAGDGSERQGEGRAPVTAPEQPRRDDGDLARRM